MATLTLNKLKKTFGGLEVIRGVDLEIVSGEFVVFVGPSGCGKSTLLRMIAGLEPITDGRLSIDGSRVNDTAASQRGIAMVFQSYALYPHMTVYKNMSFGLETARMPKTQIDTRVRRAAEALQITHLLDRRPKQLSGGQRQRVAIGRAIVRDPKIFLFDEPLSNLDAELRVQTRIEIAKLHRDIGATMIYVTHDQVEAMTLADRIVVLRNGIIEQHGSPLEIYNRPINQFVAGFIGSPKMNFIELQAAVASGGAVELLLREKTIALPSSSEVTTGSRIKLGVRPEHIRIKGEGHLALGNFQVAHVEHLGGQTIAYGRLEKDQSLTVAFEGQEKIAAGDIIELGILATHCHIFDERGHRIGN